MDKHIALIEGKSITLLRKLTAPIFNVAHYRVASDLFDVLPLLSEKLKAAK